MDAGGPSPGIGPGLGRCAGAGSEGGELLGGPLVLARFDQLSGQYVAQLDQQLHVQGRVGEPLGGQRARRPVRRRVLLQQPDPEQLGDHRPERDPRVVEQPRRQLGVEQAVRRHPDLEQARQVLAGGVDDPLRVSDARRRARRGPCPSKATGIDQVGARARSAHLDEIGPLGVAEAVCALGVDRDRAGARGQCGDRGLDAERWSRPAAVPSAGETSSCASESGGARSVGRRWSSSASVTVSVGFDEGSSARVAGREWRPPRPGAGGAPPSYRVVHPRPARGRSAHRRRSAPVSRTRGPRPRRSDPRPPCRRTTRSTPT